MPHNMQSEMTGEMRTCIQNCLDCHRICTETVAHCLQKGGRHAEAAHIRLLLDCAQICGTSADFMLRSSHFHTDVCRVCSTICEQCAEECSRMAEGDRTMQQCAEICRSCAASCQAMATTAAR